MSTLLGRAPMRQCQSLIPSSPCSSLEGESNKTDWWDSWGFAFQGRAQLLQKQGKRLHPLPFNGPYCSQMPFCFLAVNIPRSGTQVLSDPLLWRPWDAKADRDYPQSWLDENIQKLLCHTVLSVDAGSRPNVGEGNRRPGVPGLSPISSSLHGACFSLCLCLCLSLCVSHEWINKISKKRQLCMISFSFLFRYS